ncbi:hypothetical protein QEH56_24520, partial [Pelagicoccus enzymogenes]|uniref:hypothetical protein n=1 Tax=Pelagicoccus enzymogenes TaxID=2773457 RepID=UPI0028102955
LAEKMKSISILLSLFLIGVINSQEFDLTPSETLLRDDITRSDIQGLKPGMTMREVISILGYPEAASVQLPFMSYHASDRKDGYRYFLYLSQKKEEEEIFDLKIIGAETAISPWTFDQPSEVIWESEEWKKIKKERDANQSAHTTPAIAPR